MLSYKLLHLDNRKANLAYISRNAFATYKQWLFKKLLLLCDLYILYSECVPFALQETVKSTGDRACSSEDDEAQMFDKPLVACRPIVSMSPPPFRSDPTLCFPTLSFAHTLTHTHTHLHTQAHTPQSE